jgi:tetratricopeptide (TPR) repeat protein
VLALGHPRQIAAPLEQVRPQRQAISFGWGLGAAYRGLGIVAQAHGQHQQAVVMFRKGLDTFTELGGSWWVARVLAEMGSSMLALGNEAEAGRVWRKSLRIALDSGGTPVALEGLAGFASLQTKQGEREDALELLLIVLNHLASFQETKDRAEALRAELEAQLTRKQVEAAERRAKAKTFEASIEEIVQQAPAGLHQTAD